MINTNSNFSDVTTAVIDQSRGTNLSMMSQITKQIDEKEFVTIFQKKSDEDHYHKLEIAMKFLENIDRTKGVAFYFERSQQVMQHLHQEFLKNGKEELYLPWVRYFDISAKKKEEYPGKKEGTQGFLFRKGMEDLVLKAFTQNQTNTQACAIDWRIAKKILGVPNIFPEEKCQLLALIKEDAILRAVQNEINIALEQMIWLGSNSLTQTAKKVLEKLSQLCLEESSRADVIEALLSGRFDKSKFGLSHSLVLGEDGGLYLLLNRLTKENQKDMITESIVTKAYLKDKIHAQKAKDEKAEKEEKRKHDLYGEKVIIGKGGFGSVKFAMSLFRHNGTSPGDVICIKKTRNFTTLSSNGGMMYSALQQATEATIEDYFASGIADKVYAPQIFDLAIISHQSAYEGETDHRKGYLMMEMFPQNTATRIFDDRKYQKWKYQKPYLIEVLSSTLALLKENIAFTDLKPDNTLYDTNILKTTIIDLGGTIKVETTTENFEKSKYSFQTTPEYRAPEMGELGQDIINLPKALAFTCGQLMKEVARESDFENRQALDDLIEKLTQKDPGQRPTIQEAIESLEKMGDDSYKEDVVFRHYIAKVQDSIETNRSSIGLNEDVLQTKEQYISQSVTHLDPEKYKELKTEELFLKIDNFLMLEQREHQVMTIFGAAGSGKSIALQLKFIEAVRRWKTSQPLPIYFNLANGIELRTIIDSMNQILGTHITFQDLRKKGVHLYIDSFDEGLGLDGGRRETLIQEYMKELSPSNEKDATTRVKFIISCRTNYLINESNYKWFTPQPNAFDKLLTVYIVPIGYNGHANLKEMIKVYAKYKFKEMEEHKHIDGFEEETLKQLEVLHLKELITTGFMFYVVMEVLPQLREGEKDAHTRHSLHKQDIFRKYISHYQRKELKSLNSEQKNHLCKKIELIASQTGKEKAEGTDDSLNAALTELGKYIAVQLHLQDRFRLDQDELLFQVLGYDSTTHFRKQSLAYLLKLLPSKIETKYYSKFKHNKKQSQEVRLGLIHDTIKNSYLLEAIQDEMRKTNGGSKILSSKSIVADGELVRFIADTAKYDAVFKQYLRQAIDLTKSDKSEHAAIYAANAITILVAANYSFPGQDLRGINIRGADIRNGIFSGADFTGADLSFTNLGNIQADNAKLIKASLKGAKFGILPDLVGHKGEVTSISFSGDGKYLASGSYDNTVKLWDMRTSKNVATYEGHTHIINSVSFSANGKYIASGSSDKTVKVWEVQTSKCLATLQHDEEVRHVSISADGKHLASNSLGEKKQISGLKVWEIPTSKCIMSIQESLAFGVSLSADGKYLAAPSSENVKIWKVQSSECIATLKGHPTLVPHVSFSYDGKYVASGSYDHTVKVWEMQSSQCIATLQGHTEQVSSVTFSFDGMYIASASSDKTVRLWEVKNSTCLATLQHTNRVSNVSFSGDGKYIASNSRDNRVKIWEAQNSKCLVSSHGHAGSVTSVSFSNDGKYIASGSNDRTVKIWEVQSSNCLVTLEGHTSIVNSVSFSRDGKLLASGSDDKTVKIWEMETTICLVTLQHADGVKSISFSEDGKYIASGSMEKMVIWRLDTGNYECFITIEDPIGRVSSVSFSHDGKRLASGTDENKIKIWEMETSKCLVALGGGYEVVNSVSYSRDGKYVASASSDKTVKIWEMETSTCLATLQHAYGVKSISFFEEGKHIVSGSSKTLNIWKVETSECLATLEGHTEEVNSVSVSGDGKYIVSGSKDRTLRIWVNINGDWHCDKIFSASELPLSVRHVKTERIRTSKRNWDLLKWLSNQGKEKENLLSSKENHDEDEYELDETEGEMKHDLTLAITTANELSELFLKHQKARYEELLKQKLVQLTLLQVLAQSDPIQKGLLKPELFQGNKTGIKQKEKDGALAKLKPEVPRNNQIAPGVAEANNHHKHKTSCCNIF